MDVVEPGAETLRCSSLHIQPRNVDSVQSVMVDKRLVLSDPVRSEIAS